MGTMTGLEAIVAALAAIVGGLVTVGIGQVFGALREIALNTRAMAREAQQTAPPAQTTYRGLSFLAAALAVLGGVYVVGAVAWLAVVAVRQIAEELPSMPATPRPVDPPRFDARGYPIPASAP
ncbi:MAG: hypothetical protein JWM10_1932 [Myxococcaceae bacterium]|nr:hypothetical protein [Myxococcaceae bacterium]